MKNDRIMKEIFESGSFSQYRNLVNLNESRRITKSFAEGDGFTTKTTVFLSHKHDELLELRDIIGFLQKEYYVQVYIDSKDSSMPEKTSGETASRIKQIIKQCDRFILLATEGAIESKWCNWELGYGDAQKYKDRIALFPIKPKYSLDVNYKGYEYMQIYPYISYSDGYEKYKNGGCINEGYYVTTFDSDGTKMIEPLSDWFNRGNYYSDIKEYI
jgi:hypothetical protein